jgi:NADH-quinone oxidoreductase subunit L
MDVASIVNLIPSLLAAAPPAGAEGSAGGGTGVLQAAAHPTAGPWWAILIPVLPLLGCILCAVMAAARVKTKLPAWTTVACLAVSFLITVALYLQGAGGHAVTVGYEWINFSWSDRQGQSLVANFAFYVDSLTLLWMLFVTGLGTLIALYASEYMAADVGKGYARFFFAFCLFVFSMSCLVMADNLVLLYLGWEGVGLCSYLLIGYFYKKPSAVAAAKKAFIVNRIGDLGLALGIMLIFVKFGTVEYATLFANADFQNYLALARDGMYGQIPASIQAIPMLLMVGAFGKSAQFPLYVWLPDAMEGPTPVSALIHAATMVTAGVFLIARTYWVFQLSEWALPIVAWIGCITALLAATIGMAQFDIKRIMAYSTVSQLGFMFAGLGVFTATGAAYHVFTHAFFKALLFLACGAVMHGFAGQLDLRKLSGVQFMKGWKIVGLTMLVGCLNLAGFPLITSGFFSKDMILAEAFTTPGPGYQLIGWILLFTAGLTAYYTFRVYLRVFVGPQHFEPGEEHHGDDVHDESAHALPHVVAESEKFATEATRPSEAGGHFSDHPNEDAHGHGGHGHGDHHGEHFHPHAPGWAINAVLATLAVLTFVAIVPYFMGAHGGWVGNLVHHSTADWSLGAPQAQVLAGYDAAHPPARADYTPHGSFLGFDPHKAMYFVSAVVGITGILIAAFLHGPTGVWGLMLGARTRADVSRADALVPRLGPLPRWARDKWYVDEFYEFLIRTPLWVVSHFFHLIDKIVVDGLVNLAGYLPRGLGAALRPSQNGQLHGYAVGMAGGAAFILLIIFVVVVTR